MSFSKYQFDRTSIEYITNIEKKYINSKTLMELMMFLFHTQIRFQIL